MLVEMVYTISLQKCLFIDIYWGFFGLFVCFVSLNAYPLRHVLKDTKK